MKPDVQKLIIQDECIQTIGPGTFLGEIEARRDLRRFINLALEQPDRFAQLNPCNGLTACTPETLVQLRDENADLMTRLADLAVKYSPFKGITPAALPAYQVGAIVYDTWGYEQTNVDFYCIVKRSGTMVTLLPMKYHASEETSFMSNTVTPTELDLLAEPIRRKIKSYDGKEAGLGIRSYGWAQLWDGHPKTVSHYA